MNDSWLLGSQHPNLADGEIHLWIANLDDENEAFDFYKNILDEAERERAQRFRFWRDKRRFINGRGILRLLLGRYLEQAPDLIEIQYTSFGKPYLRDENLEFNLAHCQGFALYGFCFGSIIGVDIECLREVSDAEGIANRFFAPAENAYFLAAAPEMRTQRFFNIWTLKEAFIKAVGKGLSYQLDAFEVDFSERDMPRLIIEGEREKDWSFYSFCPEKGCVAGVAVHGRNWKFKKLRFTVQ